MIFPNYFTNNYPKYIVNVLESLFIMEVLKYDFMLKWCKNEYISKYNPNFELWKF